MKQKFPNFDNSNAREKSSMNIFLLQPFDFFIAEQIYNKYFKDHMIN